VDVSPAVLGVTAEAVRRLRERDEHVAMAERIAARLEAARTQAYALADEADPERVPERLAVRAEVHALSCSATAARVAAGAGRAMLLDQAAQRLARVALFLLVQGQTPAVRAAQLASFGGATGE
jgi:hypothetical protein